MPDREQSERVKVAAVVRMTGYSLRQVQELAAAGKIPSAAKLGAQWSFDPVRVRRWIKQKEREAECPRQTSSRGRASTTRASKSMVTTSDEAYERALS